MTTPASGPRVEWGALLPSEVRAAVEPLLLRWLHTAPTWCHVLLVQWDEAPDGEKSTGATMEGRPEYRAAVLTIGAAWLGESPESRESMVRHELAHLPTWPMHDLVSRMLKVVKKRDAALAADFEEQWRQALEAATCDVAESYARAASGPPRPVV